VAGVATEFRILGPVQACEGDDPLDLGGPKQRAVLALLLLHANQRVSVDRLIEGLWGESPPVTATKSLQMHIGRLRRALAGADAAAQTEGRLTTVQGGYMIRVAVGELDLHRFERKVAEGRRLLSADRPAAAARCLSGALDEWRGTALSDLADEPFAQLEIPRLDELRVAAVEDVGDAELANGHHAEPVSEIEALVVAHPFRERPRAQLMLALYRAGRQADALAAYRDARRLFTNELGIEPGRVLRELEKAILNQDAELDWRPPGELPSDVPVELPPRLQEAAEHEFFGRGPELQDLEQAWHDARGGHRRIALVGGESGIGKTRLAAQLALRARADGARVVYGHCDDALALPYLPWVEALCHYIAVAPQTLLDRHATAHGGHLARLIPELNLRVPGLVPTSGSEPDAERHLLFRAVVGLVAEAAADRPLLLVLDDVHWADEGSLQLLRHLISTAPEMPMLIVCIYRDSDMDPADGLCRILADLHREPGVLRTKLGGLEEADVVQLIAAGEGAEPSARDLSIARELTRETSGNPFFVVELLRHLDESGGNLLDAGLPDSVRDVVRQRVDRLGEPVARLLRVAAVIGREFELGLLTRAVTQDEDDVLDRLDGAARAQLLAETTDKPGRFRFAHALVNNALYDDLGATRRALLHRRVAEALEELCGPDPSARLGELAHHWTAAASDPERALEWSRRAAESALDKLAPDEAARWFAQALELEPMRSGADDGTRCDLLVGLGEAQRRAGDASYRATLIEASELARERRDGHRLANAALANSRGFESAAGSVDPERVDTLRASLDLLDPSDAVRRARLLALLQLELTFVSPLAERRRLSDEAAALARRSGDLSTLAHVLWARHAVLWTPELLGEHVKMAAELESIARHLDDPIVAFWAACDRVLTSVWTADLAAADRALARMRAIAERIGQPTLLWIVTWYGSWRAHLAGDLDQAEALAHRAAELGTASGQPDAAAFLAEQLVTIAWDRGCLHEHIANLEQAVQANPGLPVFRAWLTLAYCEAGRCEEAREALEPSASAAFHDIPDDILWLTTACLYAESSARLGARAEAALLYDAIAPYSGQIVFNASSVLGAVDRFTGLLAATLGRPGDADAHFARAAAIHKRVGAQRLLARTASDQAAAAAHVPG